MRAGIQTKRYLDKVLFISKASEELKDFVACATEENPDKRPNASALINHPWLKMTRTESLICKLNL